MSVKGNGELLVVEGTASVGVIQAEEGVEILESQREFLPAGLES